MTKELAHVHTHRLWKPAQRQHRSALGGIPEMKTYIYVPNSETLTSGCVLADEKIVFTQSNLTRNKPRLSISPMPSESQHKIHSMASLVGPYNVKTGTVIVICFVLFWFDSICLFCLFHPHRSFTYILWLQIWSFYGIPECANMCVPASIYVSCTFPCLVACYFFSLTFIYFIVLYLIIIP